MKIILGRQIEEIKKKNSEAKKNLLKNRNSEDINELDENDIYIRRNTIKNIKLGTQVVYRIYLNHNIVYELDDTVNLSLFHSLVPAATTTSIIFDKLENQDISNFNLIGYCDANNHIAVYQNNDEYLILNLRNAVIYAPFYCTKFFYNYRVLNICVFNNFNTSNVISMENMFSSCKSLVSLDLSKFDTNKVIFMSSFLSGCERLISLDVSNFNINKVSDFSNMFRTCKSLTSIDISSFKPNRVTSMYNMFYYCSSLTRIDISNFNTDNLRNCGSIFNFCSKLKTIISNSFPYSSFSSTIMFNNCNALVGGKGTKYNSSHIVAEYARIDGENGLPGYFTAPSANK